MTIPQILNEIQQGVPYNVNLEKRQIKLGKKSLSTDELDLEDFREENPLQQIESNYSLYKHSIPSERSDARRKRYFNPLPESKLSADDLLYGEEREYAQARLELHLLACIITGAITWDTASMGKWFWQSPNDPDLVLLRKWFEPDIN